jgi:hypothetical protein
MISGRRLSNWPTRAGICRMPNHLSNRGRSGIVDLAMVIVPRPRFSLKLRFSNGNSRSSIVTQQNGTLTRGIH